MRGLGYGVVGLVALGTTWLVGAAAAGLAGPLGGHPGGVALAAGTTVAIALPLVLSRRLVRALADRTPRRGPIHATSMLATNAVTLGLLLGLAPDVAKQGMEAAGDWPLFGQDVPMLSDALAARHIGTPVVAEVEPEPVMDVPDIGVSDVELAPPPEPMDAAGVFAAAADSVVVIETESPAEGIAARFVPNLRGHGSGFAVGPDLVVSNFHVAGDATSLAVRTRDGRRVAARRLAELPEDDLVLLQLVGATLEPLEIADAAVPIGAKTWAIGAPLGLEYSLTEGIVSGERDMSGTPFLQMQTTVAPGSSGGPLLDTYAHVVGVNTAVASPGLSLAVDAARVRALMELERDLESEPLPLLTAPITLVRAELPDDMLPTDWAGAESALETLVGVLSEELELVGDDGWLELAPNDCREGGLSRPCTELLAELGVRSNMLRMLPVRIEATFTDVPTTDGGTGDLTMVLHPSALPDEPFGAPTPPEEGELAAVE